MANDFLGNYFFHFYFLDQPSNFKLETLGFGLKLLWSIFDR